MSTLTAAAAPWREALEAALAERDALSPLTESSWPEWARVAERCTALAIVTEAMDAYLTAYPEPVPVSYSAPSKPPVPQSMDLVAALRRSIEAAKASRAERERS